MGSNTRYEEEAATARSFGPVRPYVSPIYFSASGRGPANANLFHSIEDQSGLFVAVNLWFGSELDPQALHWAIVFAQ